jgi:hypothetical protein
MDIERLLDALRWQESGGNANAVSPKGAIGPYQIMPKTGGDPGFGVRGINKDMMTNEAESRRFAKDYLNAMLFRYDGDVDKALAAYNAGPGNVDKGRYPQETKDYVPAVKGHYDRMGTPGQPPLAQAMADVQGQGLGMMGSPLPKTPEPMQADSGGGGLGGLLGGLFGGSAMGGGNGSRFGNGLLSIGAGLSSISNPQGAAVALKMLQDRQGDGLTAYQKAQLGLEERKLDLEEAASGVKTTKEISEAEQRGKSLVNAWGDMKTTAQEIHDAKNLPDVTGPMAWVPNRPGSEAFSLQDKVDNFKAKGVFQVLQGLREMSKTGGALGQVTDYENRLMEKAFGALNQAKQPEDFKKSLDLFMKQANRSMQNIQEAYRKQYGISLPEYEPLQTEEDEKGSLAPQSPSGFRILEVH